MNGYERIKAALELREPDTIPIMEWSFATNVIEGLTPGNTDELEMVERLGLDGVPARLPTQLGPPTEKGDRWVNQWGVVMAKTAEDYAPFDGPIKKRSDLDSYRPPDPDNEENYQGLLATTARFKGEKFIIWHGRAEFMAACEIRNMTDFLMDMATNPEFAHAVLKVVNDTHTDLAVRAIRMGADAVMLGDDWAYNKGPMMSPDQFEEFILPYFRRTVKAVQAAGGYVIKHCDGNVMPLMEMVAEVAPDGINPIEPIAMDMDIAVMKEKYGDKMAILGNVDCGETLSNAPIETVVRETKDAIREAGPGGGYVMMSSNSIHTSVNPANYQALVDTTREFGKYPLDMVALA